MLEQELYQAWEERKFAEVGKLARRIARTKYGPKRRYYRTLKTSMPTKAEWMEVWKGEGGEGGVKCTEVQWNAPQQQQEEERAADAGGSNRGWAGRRAERDIERLK
eukprot:1645901-Lingulodinium_polyedra.AAC.1